MKPALSLCLLASLLASSAYALSERAALMVEVDRISQDKPIPELFALCEATPDGKSTAGKNERPAISWSRAPKDTKSFAVIVTDPDVPADFSKAGKEGMSVGKDDPRQMFYHWGLVDIPATATRIEGGATDKPIGFGKPVKNSLGSYLPDDRRYGGPCPPWNDARVHHYHFTVYALSVESLKLPSNATAKQAEEAIRSSDSVLAQGEVVGTYTLNKHLRQ